MTSAFVSSPGRTYHRVREQWSRINAISRFKKSTVEMVDRNNVLLYTIATDASRFRRSPTRAYRCGLCQGETGSRTPRRTIENVSLTASQKLRDCLDAGTQRATMVLIVQVVALSSIPGCTESQVLNKATFSGCCGNCPTTDFKTSRTPHFVTATAVLPDTSDTGHHNFTMQ